MDFTEILHTFWTKSDIYQPVNFTTFNLPY